MKSVAAKRIGLLAACMTLSTVVVLGQDLGSANKLFGVGAKTSSGSSKTTKSPAKAKASPKPKSTARKIAPLPKPTKSTPSSGRSTTGEKPKTSSSAKNVDIQASKAVGPVVKASVAADISFDKLIDEGNAARDTRNYGAAEAAYRRAKGIKPGDSRAVYGLGNLYGDQQRWEEAETAYRAALELEPSNAIAHIALSYVLTQPIAAPNLSDRYDEAERLARRAIQLAASNPLAFDQLGVALELRGLIGAETENAYRRAIQLDASFAPAYAHLGRLLRRRGMAKEAAVAYQNAISRSTDVATMILVAGVMQSEQRFAESEQLLRSALASDPKNPTALLMLGRALTIQGKYFDAETTLRKGLLVSPNAFAPNSLLGSLYWRQGKYEQAENALLQAVRFVSPLEKRQLAQQFETLGDAYFKAGLRGNAERAYRQALALDADNKTVASKLPKGQSG